MNSFPYPHGAWNREHIRLAQQLGFDSAFQLSDKAHTLKAAFTLRRIMINRNWSPLCLLQQMNLQFHLYY